MSNLHPAYAAVDPEFVAFYMEETNQPESVVRCCLAADIEPPTMARTMIVGFNASARKAFEKYLPSFQPFTDTF